MGIADTHNSMIKLFLGDIDRLRSRLWTETNNDRYDSAIVVVDKLLNESMYALGISLRAMRRELLKQKEIHIRNVERIQ